MTRRTTQPARVRLAVPTVLLGAAVVLGACSSSSSTSSKATTTSSSKATTTAAPATTANKSRPLVVLVTNDDGYSAPGIDAVVEGLRSLPDVEVHVVAPLTNESGTGGKTTPGTLAVTDQKTKSGFVAKAVAGYPADTVRVAIDDLKIHPDLVVSGINAGQNVGPSVDLSGTIGAARAAVARGIPAFAAAQGFGDSFDFPVSVPIVRDWVQKQRAALLAGSEPVHVTSLNAPSCASGTKMRGLLTNVTVDTKASLGEAVAKQNCASTAAPDVAAGDVTNLTNGWATEGLVPDKAGA